MNQLSPNAELLLSTSTPALFAQTVSNGKWKMAPHLAYLDQALTDTITTGGRLLISIPPRHGKSELCSRYLPAWYLGTFPERRVMFGSYEADFAKSWGRRARMLLEEFGRKYFDVEVNRVSAAANRWDLAGFDGGMQTAGVGGPFTGKGAHLLIVDDPIKGHEEAASETLREKMWDWWRANAYTRLEPDGAAIVIATRWHEDDLIGRLLSDAEPSDKPWRYVRLPALAEPGDLLGRAEGNALWPARFNESTLLQMSKDIGSHWFSALYQQRPTPRVGGFFKVEKIRPVDSAAVPVSAFRTIIRGWDKAYSQGDGDFTSGVLIAEAGGTYYILDVVRGQWSSGLRDDNIDLAASLDETTYGEKVQIWFEIEPAAGKQTAEISLSRLRGYRAHAERSGGSKEVRADQLASQIDAGNVCMVKAPWNQKFIEELRAFPRGAHDDQVDAASLAFNKLARPMKKLLVGSGT